MFKLYWYFISYTLRSIAKAIPVVLLLILALDRLGVGYVVLQVVLIAAGTFVPLITGVFLFQRELSWILNLPVKKSNILLSKFLTHLSLFTLYASAAYCLAFAFSLIKFGWSGTLSDLADIHSNLFRAHGPYTIYSAMSDLLIYSTLTSVLLLIPPQSAGKSSPASANPAKKKKRLLTLAALGVLAYVFRSFINNSFAIFAIAQFVFWVAMPWSSTVALGLAKRQRHRWLAIGALIAILQISSLYLFAMRDLHSGSPDKEAEAIVFVGPYTRSYDEPQLAHLLEQNIETVTIVRLGELYRTRFFKGEKVTPKVPHTLDLARSLASKDKFEQVTYLAENFDLSKFTLPEIRIFLTKLTQVRKGENADYFVYNFLGNGFPPDKIIELLDSGDDESVFFALIYARFHRDSQYIAPILKNLSRYPNNLQWASELTLSILGGAHFTPTQLESLASGKLKLSFASIDCAKYSLPPLKKLTDQGLPTLNSCVRERSLWLPSGTQQKVDNEGWYKPPFSHNALDQFKLVFKLKNLD